MAKQTNSSVNNMISVVIPAFNEGDTVRAFAETMRKHLADEMYELIFVDDGSTDGCCDRMDAEYTRVVRHVRNRGYGAALKTGILKAEGSWIVTCDSDGQHRPEDVLNVVRLLANHDVVVGARGKDSYAPLMRRPGKKVLTWVTNYLAERKIPDLNSGLRAFRRPVVMRMLHLMPDGFSFSTTSTLASFNMGYDVFYTPIKVEKRVGRSTVSQVRHGAQTILLIIRLIALFNPLKVFLPTSLLLLGLGVVQFTVEAVVNRLHITPTVVVLMLASLLVFFFGILTDQVAAMRRELTVNRSE